MQRKPVSKVRRKIIHKSTAPYWRQFYDLFIEEFIKDELGQRAAAVAFSFTLSVFPIIIFLFSIIPYIPIPHLDQSILNYLREALPSGIYNDSQVTIQAIVTQPQAGILSFGFLATLYASTSGMTQLMSAFEKCGGVPLNRSFIKEQFIAVVLVLTLGLGLLLSTGAIIIGEYLITNFADLLAINSSYIMYPIQLVRYGGSFLILITSTIVIFSTSSYQPQIRYQWKGAVISVLGIILVTKIFSFYLANFASYNKIYGSIGTFIAFMVWINLVSTILLCGYEINTIIHRLKIGVHVVKV